MGLNDSKLVKLAEVRQMLAPLSVYTVEGLLGTGAMGDVVLVRHRVFGLRAIKLVHADYLRSETLRKRFDNEALVMHRLNHPNLVRVHELGEIGDKPYILMDYVGGGSLQDHLTTFGPMPPRQAVSVIIAILRGLQTAHENAVVHRDIKPQNILFTEDGVVKVTDFGIAHLEDQSEGLTHAGAAIGTFAYMAPEQLNGETDIDARADIHAVGVTLYVVLTLGKLGKQAFCYQLDQHPERIADLDATLQMVIHMATGYQRDSRFASARAMIEELEMYLQDLPEDPPDTPKLGSAPSVKRSAQVVVRPDARLAQEDSNVSATRAQQGFAVPGDTAGAGSLNHVSHVPDLVLIPPHTSRQRKVRGQGEVLPSGTIHPDGSHSADQAQIAQIKRRAQLRLLRSLAPIGLVALLLAGVLGVARSVKNDVSIEVATPEPTPVPIVEAVSLTPTPEVVVEREPDHIPEPTPTPEVVPRVRVEPKVPRLTPEPKKVVVRETPPVVEAAMVPNAQVHLDLKGKTLVTLSLKGEGGSFTTSGNTISIPAGVYTVGAKISDRETIQTGTITLPEGVTTIICDDRFGMCKWSK